MSQRISGHDSSHVLRGIHSSLNLPLSLRTKIPKTQSPINVSHIESNGSIGITGPIEQGLLPQVLEKGPIGATGCTGPRGDKGTDGKCICVSLDTLDARYVQRSDMNISKSPVIISEDHFNMEYSHAIIVPRSGCKISNTSNIMHLQSCSSIPRNTVSINNNQVLLPISGIYMIQIIISISGGVNGTNMQFQIEGTSISHDDIMVTIPANRIIACGGFISVEQNDATFQLKIIGEGSMTIESGHIVIRKI